MVSEVVDAHLECQATGNPLTKGTVNWHRQGFDMEANTEQSFGLGVAYLTVRQVNRIDTGVIGIGHRSTDHPQDVASFQIKTDNGRITTE